MKVKCHFELAICKPLTENTEIFMEWYSKLLLHHMSWIFVHGILKIEGTFHEAMKISRKLHKNERMCLLYISTVSSN